MTPQPGADDDPLTAAFDDPDGMEFSGRRFKGSGAVELPAGEATETTVDVSGYAFSDEADQLELKVSAGDTTIWVTLRGEDRLAFLDEVHRVVTETTEADA